MKKVKSLKVDQLGLLLLLIGFIMAVSLTGCGMIEDKVKEAAGDLISEAMDNVGDNEEDSDSNEADDDKEESLDKAGQLEGLPSGFPVGFPFYKGAVIIDSDTFSGNHYTVMYMTDAAFSKVLDFYVYYYNLDASEASEEEAYYEGIEAGSLFINGLTIEDNGSGVNVFVTLEDQSGSDDEYAANEDNGSNSGDMIDSDLITYDNAEEVPLDSAYPSEEVPIYPEAKVLSCSLVPGKSTGFVELILPSEDFESAISYYTDTLSIEPKMIKTALMETAEFQGRAGEYKVSLLLSHLFTDGNDTYVQISISD